METHHVEEDVEGVGLPRVSGDEADKSDEVDSGGLHNDRSFFRKAEVLARVANRVLAHPDAISDQHCMQHDQYGERGRGRKDHEREHSPFTATVELKNDLAIFSCFAMKTESPLASPERPWTDAIPVPAYVNQRDVQRRRV